MYEVRQTAEFRRWLDELRDHRGRERVLQRLERLAAGNLGDVRPLGGKLAELRLDTGPGYRLYFVRRGALVVLLLCGGDKASQDRDILRARKMAEDAR